MTRTRYRIFEDQVPHFLTCTVVGWLPVFTRPETVEIVLDSWRFLIAHGRLELYGYVVLENHVHFIASSNNLSKEVGDFKSYTARRILDLLVEKGERRILTLLRLQMERHKQGRESQYWQEGSHPQQILTPAMMEQKLEYIHQNPVSRGYVDDPTHWRCSSARNYAGMEGLLPVNTSWRWGTDERGEAAERPDSRPHAERGNEQSISPMSRLRGIAPGIDTRVPRDPDRV